jgi:hypothetical protein
MSKVSIKMEKECFLTVNHQITPENKAQRGLKYHKRQGGEAHPLTHFSPRC